MNELMAIFFTWQFVCLAIGICAITFLVRTTVEYFVLNNPKMPGNSKSRFWRDFVLVILPLVIGFTFPLLGKSFPYPTAINEIYSKFLFSASAGLLSPTLYRVIKAFLWKNAKDNSSDNSFINIVSNSPQSTADEVVQDPPEPKV